MDIEQAFLKSELFRGLDVKSFSGYTLKYSSGEKIKDEYEGKSCIGIVLCGIVDVFMIAPDGNEFVVNSISSGGCFGVSNLMTQQKLESVLITRTETTLYFIPTSEVIEHLRHNNAFAVQYASFLNGRIEFLLHKIELLTTASARGKLIAFLLLHREEDGHVQFPRSRDLLAEQLGISRAALFRELSALQQFGVLKREHKGFVVPDQKALEKFLN